MAFPRFLPDALPDEFYSQNDIEELKNLCLEYNRGVPDPIEVDEIQNDKIAMIIALWMRRLKISENLTFGSPYDNVINKEILQFISREKYYADLRLRALEENTVYQRTEDDVYIAPKARETIFYKLFIHPSQLQGFIATGIYNILSYIDRRRIQGLNDDSLVYYSLSPTELLFKSLNESILELGFARIENPKLDVFTKILAKLNSLSLIYIILRGIFSPDVSVRIDVYEYFEICYPSL